MVHYSNSTRLTLVDLARRFVGSGQRIAEGLNLDDHVDAAPVAVKTVLIATHTAALPAVMWAAGTFTVVVGSFYAWHTPRAISCVRERRRVRRCREKKVSFSGKTLRVQPMNEISTRPTQQHTKKKNVHHIPITTWCCPVVSGRKITVRVV